MISFDIYRYGDDHNAQVSSAIQADILALKGEYEAPVVKREWFFIWFQCENYVYFFFIVQKLSIGILNLGDVHGMTPNLIVFSK